MAGRVGRTKLGAGAALAVLVLSGHAPPPQPRPDALIAGFQSPPKAAAPRVWWHWMNGNITRDGIRRDLDWMARVGIGGVDAIDASIDTPQVVTKRLVYMTPEWKGALRYAAGLAAGHGMEFAIDSSPGWSETGGPWVAPDAAMKKLVWSRTEIEGGQPFHGVLPRPPDVPGPFQDIAKAAPGVPRYYRDSLVIAYRAPVAEPQPVSVSSNAGSVAAPLLHDGALATAVTLKPPAEGGPVWIALDYGRPQTLQGLTLALAVNDGLGFAARIEAGEDGQAWHAVTTLPKAAQVRRFALLQQTIAFAPVTARYFRLLVTPAAPIPTSLRVVDYAPGAVAAAPVPPPPESARNYRLYELAFHAAATVNEFEKKAGFAIARDNYAIATTAENAADSAVAPDQVIDLTARMTTDGTLDWTPPPGRWTVLRLGSSLTGAQNHPATPEATGLEVDKLNAGHVRDYLSTYLDTYAAALGPDRRNITALMVDSTEVGAQNWTQTILADFRRLRGYDPLPWLPALTGAVVRNPVDSDRFLWDWRRTIAQLVADNHYGEIAQVAKARGLTLYGEALEDHRPTFGDDIEMRRFADIPMGAMWSYAGAPRATYVADLLGAASVANLYGRKLVAAESLTSAGQPWAYSPRLLKPIVDLEFALGVNRIVIHTSVHQPVEKPPGLSLGGYGQFFNRLESWGNEAGAWVRYIARCSFLLQQGRHAADIAYFYGEEAPITGLFGDAAIDVPAGHGFDFVGSDAVLNLLSVDHGMLVTPSGMRYRLLYLGGSSRFMTLAVLQRIHDLVEQGAVVVGHRPQASPSLADDDAAFQALADDMFGGDVSMRHLGQGTLFASDGLEEAMAELKLAPDFDYAKPQADSEVLYIHRHLPDGELYFLTNRRDRPQAITATFRVAGLPAQLLNPVSGTITRPAVRQMADRSIVALDLPAYGSTFVLFRKGGGGPASAPVADDLIRTLDGPWHVAFQPGRGAPGPQAWPVLKSWTDDAHPGLRYFSGTADYTTGFTLPARLPPGRLVLDLGQVRELATATLNGKPVGTAWTAPFALDITKAVRPGRNVLRLKVANLWVNRLIGDAQPEAGGKYSFTTIPTYRADAPLLPSGLLGPVTIRRSGF